LDNPTSIGTKTLSWEGRRLKAIPSDNILYTYNEQGIRTTKNVNGDITTYYLKGSNIIAEKKNQVTTLFNYNEQDGLIGFENNNNQYFYVRVLLGKITEVIDSTGLEMVTYKYDAWGNWINKISAPNRTSLGNTLVELNPFIYKGYYYDSETDWYYLKSRYYCPVLSRFINIDSIDYLKPGNIDGVNLFSYCGNNPIMNQDESGSKWWKKALIAIAIIAVTAVIASAGGAAALVGVGVSLLGASAGTASAVAVMIGSYVVAGGIAALGLNEAIDVTSGKNLIRDELMNGNQTAYDITKYTLLATGALIITAGAIAPHILKNSYNQPNFGGNNLKLYGQDPKAIIANTRGDGFQTNIFDTLGRWSCRIDAYTQINHVNPHVHFGDSNSKGKAVRTIWKAIKYLFGL